ncbi:MAG: type III-B CRISPR-associated protein Cas10/Cmr2, partial [Ardenticatenales bacterium]|nr:type III-B CRISPR-associated protein Cas10/Cmr2 [Ardenticatenales bacterium]
MSVYLAFSIGPVQTFIAEARRTQDLRFGSYVLAQLAREAVSAVERVMEGSVIYPIPLDPDITEKAKRSVAVPSQLLAVFSEEKQAVEAAKYAAAAVQAEWDRVADRVRKKLETLPDFNKGAWEEQVQRFPKIYWVTYDDHDQSASYGESIRQVERALHLRKRLRDFEATHDEGLKCSVCGLRAVIGKTPFWDALSRRVNESQIKASSNEKLCAVCTTKRFALAYAYSPESYPSTSTMAAAPFIRALVEQFQQDPVSEVKEALERHRQALDELKGESNNGRFFNLSNPLPDFKKFQPNPGIPRNPALELLRWDGDTLFPETFAPNRLKNDYGIDLKDTTLGPVVSEAAQATRALIGVVRRQLPDVRPPTPYYALILMDGDRMGELLREAPNKGWHQSFSRALGIYADETVPKIVEQEHAGRLVYAGGDDVLALAPIDEALQIAERLRQAFCEAIREALEALEAPPLLPPDMSGGIAIAHHMSPLEVALRGVREAEKAAKGAYGRSALVVRLVKRSGVPMQMGMQWGAYQEGASKNPRVGLFQQLQDAFRGKQLASRFAHRLFEEAPVLAGLPEA